MNVPTIPRYVQWTVLMLPLITVVMEGLIILWWLRQKFILLMLVHFSYPFIGSIFGLGVCVFAALVVSADTRNIERERERESERERERERERKREREPTEIRSFIVPKEGKNPERCEDKCEVNNELRRYAVADGVGRAFLSAQWAKIIAKRFVIHDGDFADEQKFELWLQEGKREWRNWATHEWIPVAQRAGLTDDWEGKLRHGSQTTLVGCSLTTLPTDEIDVYVLAVGDAHFFLVRPTTQGGVRQLAAFPYRSSNEFGPAPDTLGTSKPMIQGAWERVKIKRYIALPGDYIVLTTDALAKWIFVQQEKGNFPWQKLLFITSSEAFRDFVLHKRESSEESGGMERDDTTMLVIPL